MKKEWLRFSITMIVIVVSIFVYINSSNGAVRTVNVLIEKVEEGDIEAGELSNEQVNAIKEMFTFSDDNGLDSPNISVRKLKKIGDNEQIMAAFNIFQYSSNGSLENIYFGDLIFVLAKKSIFKWEVVAVRTLEKMQKYESE